MEHKVEDLLGQLSLEEKVGMLAGVDMWRTRGVPRLGIPGFKVTDGPNGARGGSFDGPTAACLPCGSALAASWNTDLVAQVGAMLGEEARSKGAQMLLAPTVNIHRSPLGGRNFECYSEDPYLSARMAIAFINGVQSTGVGACIKHFVANDSEFERHSISSQVGERALREIYLAPFEAAVKEAEPWALMAAYNKVDGVWASENPRLLTEILREEWGFEGFVVSDWGGTHTTVDAARAGLDLEMPGPARFLGDGLLEAVRAGHVDVSIIDDKVRRLLAATFRSNPPAQEKPEESLDRPEHRRVARAAAVEGCVLLKNDGPLLPFSAGARSLAVIGPCAEVTTIFGGGSAQVSPHYAVSALDGIRQRCAAAGENGEAVEVRFERGCTHHRSLPALDPRQLRPVSGEDQGESRSGFAIEYFNSLDLSGEPVVSRVSGRTQFNWFGKFSQHVDPARFSVRCRGVFTPTETGAYEFSLTSAGLSRLFIDDRELIDNWSAQRPGDSFFGAGSAEESALVELEAGRPCELRVEFGKREGGLLSGLKIGCLRPTPDDLLERAVATAAGADVAVVVVGLNAEWETEGSDRVDMELPGRQVELIERVAAANPRTVVVLNAGSPLHMPWRDRVPAILQLWYPGQEAGNALAALLFGDANPSGRLPTTFPLRIEDNPAYLNYPGENGEVVYGEGVFVGYRYYDAKKVTPLFPFGHGLSYTTFEYRDLRVEAAGLDDPVRVSLEVRNTGTRRGQEVVQLYLRDVEATLARPEQELKAFAKLDLEAGAADTLTFVLDRTALAFYDPARPGWVAEPGEFEIRIGASSRDIRLQQTIELHP